MGGLFCGNNKGQRLLRGAARSVYTHFSMSHFNVLARNTICILAASAAWHLSAWAAVPAAISPSETVASIEPPPWEGTDWTLDEFKDWKVTKRLFDPPQRMNLDSEPYLAIGANPSPTVVKGDLELLIKGNVSFPKSAWTEFRYAGRLYRWRTSLAASVSADVSASMISYNGSAFENNTTDILEFEFIKGTERNPRVYSRVAPITVQWFDWRAAKWLDDSDKFKAATLISSNLSVRRLRGSWLGMVVHNCKTNTVNGREDFSIDDFSASFWVSAKVSLRRSDVSSPQLSEISFSPDQTLSWDWKRLRYIGSAMSKDTMDYLGDWAQ